MSKRYKHAPVNLADFKDKMSREGAIPVVAGDRTFYIRPAHLLGDDEYRAFMASDDQVEQARMLVDDYDGFAAAGGTAMLIMAILAEAVSELQAEQGATPGESGASSGS